MENEQSSGIKVLRDWWFTTPDGTVGLVAVQDRLTKEKKLYIGPGHGRSQMIDRERILTWGIEVSREFLQGVIKVLKK